MDKKNIKKYEEETRPIKEVKLDKEMQKLKKHYLHYKTSNAHNQLKNK